MLLLSLSLVWTPVADLPDAVGRKGMYAGLTGGRIVLAGGSNFPVPRNEGGKKTFHRSVFVQSEAARGRGPWTVLSDVLPCDLAEGATVTTPHGVVALGGDDGKGPVNTVFLLVWDEVEGTLRVHPVPALPLAVANAAAAWHDGRVYVAGGDDGRGGTLLFCRLDLAAALRDPAAARWEALPAWPGPRRFGAVLVPLGAPGREMIVLAGGKIGTPGPASARDYLADAYGYDPGQRSWRELPALPRPALIAAALRLDENRLLLAGGSDGHDIERLAELGDRYRLPADAMFFDAAAGGWRAAGAMPIGVAGAAVVALTGGGHLVAGGEYSPSLRTPRVFVVEASAP